MDIFYDNYSFSSIPEYCIPDSNTLNSLDSALDFIN